MGASRFGRSIRNRQGVTLLEVMVVIVVIGILSSLAVSSFRGTTGITNLDGTAQTLYYDMMWAKDAAIRTGQPYYLKLVKGTSEPYLTWTVYDSSTRTVRRKGSSGVSVTTGVAYAGTPTVSDAVLTSNFFYSEKGTERSDAKLGTAADSCIDGVPGTDNESWNDYRVKFCGGTIGTMEMGAIFLRSTRDDAQSRAIVYNRTKSLKLMRYRYMDRDGSWEAY